MIDSVIYYEAKEHSKGDVIAVKDGDNGMWTAFARENDMALLSRSTKTLALRDGAKYLHRMKNPIRCCGRTIPFFDGERCLRCGEDYSKI